MFYRIVDFIKGYYTKKYVVMKTIHRTDIRGHFYEKPIGTSKTGNLVFLCTPTSTLDGPKYSIFTSHWSLFSGGEYPG